MLAAGCTSAHVSQPGVGNFSENLLLLLKKRYFYFICGRSRSRIGKNPKLREPCTVPEVEVEVDFITGQGPARLEVEIKSSF